MQYILAVLLIFLQISDVTWAIGNSPQPYCDRNKTEISYKMVTKTRNKTVSKKGLFNKLTFKKETQVEVYEDQEPVYKIKLERACCDGYKMSELNLCEPQCDQNGCPEHSKCVEPEVCECKRGYFSERSLHDDKQYCQPICEQACPEHSVCVAPNDCACKKGYRVADGRLCKPYCPSGCPHSGVCLAPNICACPEGFKSQHGSCLPICSLGDQCQNGKCVDKDECECNYGYVLNTETNICQPHLAKFKENQDNEYVENSSFSYPDITESIDQTDFSLELETDIDTSNDDVDPNEVFDEMIESTTYSSTEDVPYLHHTNKCPDDYVFHQGQCRPLKFASLEIDCHFKPCNDAHAICQENGTCTCTEGYKWFKSQQHQKASCLSLADYEARLLQLQDDPQKTEVPESSNWAYIFFIVLGVLISVTAIIYLVWKMVHLQTGELDVEGKSLSCAYDNRACVDPEKSVI